MYELSSLAHAGPVPFSQNGSPKAPSFRDHLATARFVIHVVAVRAELRGEEHLFFHLRRLRSWPFSLEALVKGMSSASMVFTSALQSATNDTADSTALHCIGIMIIRLYMRTYMFIYSML